MWLSIAASNCQAAVDGDLQVIVAMGVSNQPPDVEHLEPMLERTIANTGACPEAFTAVAAGFCAAVGKMARKLRKKEGREIYAKCKTIEEPVFGQTKEARGLRRFLLCGLTKWCMAALGPDACLTAANLSAAIAWARCNRFQ